MSVVRNLMSDSKQSEVNTIRMKTLLAIPNKEQVKYLEQMVEHIEAMSVKPDKVLYLQDRPSAREMVDCRKILSGNSLIEQVVVRDQPEHMGHPQMVYGEYHFLTGHVREVAIDYMVKNGYDIIVFIDGDCLPEPDLIKDHAAILGTAGGAAVTIGQRKEYMHGWVDQRMTDKSKMEIFFKEPTEVKNEGYFVDSGVVWTCNFGMNADAVTHLRRLNQLLYSRYETFHSDFLGTWGGEDGFIGMECFYTGLPVYALPIGDNGIKHQYHDRRSAKYQHVSFISFLEAHREQLIFLLNLYKVNPEPIEFLPRSEILVKFGLVETEDPS